MSKVAWKVPDQTLGLLDQAPADRPVALLLRHSVRGPLPPPPAGGDVPLTAEGQRLSRQLGRVIGARLRSVHTSPLLRTVQTAEGVVVGSGEPVAVRHDRLLGDPGVYVLDGRAADAFNELGHWELMRRLVEEDVAVPGFAVPGPAARFLVQHMLRHAEDAGPGFSVFCTHDSVLGVTAARVLGRALGKPDWPWFLEAAAFWRDGDEVHVAYRDWAGRSFGPLVGLSEPDVLDFARRELAATVGRHCAARFFLAGGAFKTLITGRPATDLDLWAASPEDRRALVETLLSRGAEPAAPRPYSDAFRLAGREVDVPHATDPSVLEARLRRFDLALSCVGVEHRPGGQLRAVVDPLALESVARREVLLLPELLNWKHALVTLERMRRYAVELDFSVSPSAEARLWEIFERQDGPEQRRMLERFDRVARGDQGVREEAACRFR